jgi:hypothetical protein
MQKDVFDGPSVPKRFVPQYCSLARNKAAQSELAI